MESATLNPARSVRRPSHAPAARAAMRPWYRLCRYFCQLFFLSFCRGRSFGVRNVPLQGGVLLVCNHQSFLDPVLATLALPRECHYMARDSLFHKPRFKRLIESLNAFPVKRGTADISAIKETLKRLKAGGLVTVFPEGTRTSDGSIQEMQPGVVLVARKAGVPIVPTMIDGAFQAWPRTAKLPRPGRIIVAYGEPISAQQLATLDESECIAMVRGRIIELMRRHGLKRDSV